jgi:DNA-binding NtrC family response regulator
LEYVLWFKYVQPILGKYQIEEFQYYIRRDIGRNYDRHIKSPDTTVVMGHAPWNSTDREKLEDYDIVNSILRARNGEECDVAKFIKGLRLHIREGLLPDLLDELNKKVNETPALATVEVPDITHLFEPSLEEARKHFELIYLKHKIKTCEGDIGKAAEKLDMTEKALKQKLYRAREKIRKLKSQF